MKGQVSIEFFIYFSISLLALSVLATSVVNKQVETIEYRESRELSSMASKLAFELENAQNFGEGYERNFTVVPRIRNEEYSLEVQDGYVKAILGNESIIVPSGFKGKNFTLKSENSRFEVVNNGSVYITSK